jgi:hypothetical protein
MTHPVDRFRAALQVLAGHGHIKQRLTKSFEEYLSDIEDDELPIALKQDFADLRQSLQSVAPSNGESAVCASVRKMSPADASECAGEIVMLFGALCRVRDEGAASLPPGEARPVRVPPFLVESG